MNLLASAVATLKKKNFTHFSEFRENFPFIFSFGLMQSISFFPYIEESNFDFVLFFFVPFIHSFIYSFESEIVSIFLLFSASHPGQMGIEKKKLEKKMAKKTKREKKSTWSVNTFEL